ncbi:MAG: threonine synthase [Firmicutes bacterium]|nr:threonine synthase [Bacillota bacterium]
MKYVKGYECSLCHKFFPIQEELFTCPDCGEKGILDIIYDYEAMKKEVTKEYFLKNSEKSMWRYHLLMSVNEELLEKTLKVGNTPLYTSFNLASIINVKTLYIKDEGLNPTQSLKDRASAVAVIKAMEKNQTTLACSSTGNAASSLAGNAARMGLNTVIFVPKRAPVGKLTQLLYYGATVIKVDGDYKDAFQLSKLAINHYKWYNRNAAINPHLVEGKKTVAFEIAEQLQFKPTDWVVVSVGDGCTIAGVYKGFYDLFRLGLIDKIPKLLGVQSEGCSPFVEAYESGLPLAEAEELTIADSIAVGIPRNPIKAINAVKLSLGSWMKVSDKLILDSMVLLGKTEGIFAEPAAAASLAGLIQARKQNVITKEDSVTIIVTGNGLKDTQNALKAIQEPPTLKPNLSELINYLKTRGENDE